MVKRKEMVKIDKFIKILANQNPEMEIDCKTPQCKKKSKVKTLDFFSSPDGIFKYVCPYCQSVTNINGIDEQINKLKKQFKSMGITW